MEEFPFPGREEEYIQLAALTEGPAPPLPLWVYGESGLGKSALVAHALRGKKCAFVSCVEERMGQPRALVEAAARQLQVRKAGGGKGRVSTLEQLEEALLLLPSSHPPLWLVVDDAQVLGRRPERFFLSALLRLSQRVACVGLVFVSLLDFGCFASSPDCDFSPLQIHFGSYSTAQLERILMLPWNAGPGDEPQRVTFSSTQRRHRPGFVKYLVSSLSGVAPLLGVPGLRQAAIELYPIYLAPLSDGSAKDKNVSVLQRAIHDGIKTILSQNVQKMLKRPARVQVEPKNQELIELNSYNVLQLSMPVQEAAILLSAFLAACVEKKDDNQLFSLESSRKRLRRSASSKKKERRPATRAFKMSRLLFIYRHVVQAEPSWSVTHDWMCTVNSLVNQSYLQRVGEFKLSGDPSFRFRAPAEIIPPLAEALDYDLSAIIDSH